MTQCYVCIINKKVPHEVKIAKRSSKIMKRAYITYIRIGSGSRCSRGTLFTELLTDCHHKGII